MNFDTQIPPGLPVGGKSHLCTLLARLQWRLSREQLNPENSDVLAPLVELTGLNL